MIGDIFGNIGKHGEIFVKYCFRRGIVANRYAGICPPFFTIYIYIYIYIYIVFDLFDRMYSLCDPPRAHVFLVRCIR